jgi:hypothetical protein
LWIWTYTGPQFDAVVINDHVVGGTGDRVVAVVWATVFGALGMFALLMCRGRVAEWSARRRGVGAQR